MVKDDKKDTYQESVTAPLNREHDDHAGSDAEGLEDYMGGLGVTDGPLGEALTAIPKVCLKTFVVRGSWT